MSGVQNGGKRGRGARGLALGAGLALVALLLVYAAAGLLFKSDSGQGLKPLAKGEMAKLQVGAAGEPPPALQASGPDGKTVSLADLKGRVVVVNLWASWCAPCVKEMPTLAKLQADYAGKGLKVLPISLDKGDDVAKAKLFLADKPPLQFYHADYSLAFALMPTEQGLPTTILYDRTGREQARLAGGADWSSPEARAVIARLLAAKS